ncbi:MAG: serine/threonine protein kinase [Sandaracinus sp.]|nr:serine/threonine protein kinase [Sandaracinus sp.]
MPLRGDAMDLPRPFGPYTLLRRLAVGGMAEVYVAKTRGLGGFEKLVGIKVIHPRYSEDEHFVQMLVEEAKLSVLLTHVNIAQTFDLGCIDDTYFIVMELVEGADAYKLLQRAHEHRTPMPIDVCTYVAAEMCNGLDYAHRKKDVSGQPLHIVHRDISPQNVLLSFAGEVKIVDFGIAKAAMRSGQTEVGVIKGKYYYMSPEQAWADPIDSRSDVFSTGIVLHELLTGRMLYQEENLPRLLDRVRKADIAPPSRVRPEVPPELDAIVMKALAKHAADRYATAHDLSQALSQFLFRLNPTFTPARVAGLMAQLFPKELTQATGSYRLPSGEIAVGSTGVGKRTTDSLAPMKRPVEYRPDPKKSVIFDLAEFEDESTSKQVPRRRNTAAPVASETQEDDEDDFTVVEGRPRLPKSSPPAVEEDDESDWDETTVAARPKLTAPVAPAEEEEDEDEDGWGDETLVDAAGEVVLRMREALERQVAARNAQRVTTSSEIEVPGDRELPERPAVRRSVPPPPPAAALAPSRTAPATSWPPSSSVGVPDLTHDPWGDGTGTPARPPGSDPFVVRPVESTMKLPAVQDEARATRLRWGIASALVVLALGGGWLVRDALREEAPVATLEVVSRPPGARVLLGGRELPGRTPIGGIDGLTIGQPITLEVTLENHEPWRGEVTPVAGTLQKVAVLAPLRRDVVVESSPPGGQVWIDGVLHGALPRRLEDLAYGRTLDLRVTWPRGPTVQQPLRVDASTPERLVVQAP